LTNGPGMKRVMFFIDGFNVYHALADKKAYRKYLWLDYSALANCFVSPKDKIVDIFYFTAYATWNPKKVARHKMLVTAWRMKGIEPVFGRFKLKDKNCPLCKKTYQTYEEKESDVNIAIKLFQAAINNDFDTAILISGDSDLLPAVNAVKQTFPAKQIGVIIPIGRSSFDLKNACDFHMKVKQKHLKSSQLPDKIVLDASKGTTIERPPHWK
jgi:uncharacterized LabA/DUF88 family protein